LTTAEVMDPEWIGLQGWANDPNWVLNPHQDYPRLGWEGTPGQAIPEPNIDWMAGQGTSEMPYEIDDPNQLLILSKASLFWQKDLVLTRDVDIGQILWYRALFPHFSGTFDGNGYAIRHLRISGESHLGFFGRLEEGGKILNLKLVDVTIAGRGDRIGALAGESDGSVANCHSTGEVNGAGNIIGGLVGFYHGGSISNCYSNGAVTGNSGIGGLVGYNWIARVSNCYSIGAVVGNDHAGGLIGWSYYAGAPRSFWDVETSGQTASDRGTGLTTAEMMTAAAFLEAGWDFVGEVENGVEDVWWIDEGVDYPRLWWERADAEF